MRWKSMAAVAALSIVVAACAPPAKKRGPTPFDRTVDASCYTVDLFTPSTAEPPGDDVPEAWRGFSGSWGGGAWEGRWCHDLYVLRIEADGEVEVIEAHAPFYEWGREATAFRRKGRITKQGRLELRYKNVVVEYWLDNGKLNGLRHEGTGAMRIRLTHKPHDA